MLEIDQIMVAEGSTSSHENEVSFETLSDGGGGFNPDSYPTSDTDTVDADLFITKESGGWVRKAASKIWNYIKGKADSVYATVGHTHNLSLATDSGTSAITLVANTKYKLTSGGKTLIFTTPTDNATDNTKVAKAGDTMTGSLKIGNPANTSTFPSVGLSIHDTRGIAQTPAQMNKQANFFFSNNTMPDTGWWAGLHVRGWDGEYGAWELVGTAHNSDKRTAPLYVRTSNKASAWGSWRKIYDTSNKPSASDVGLGNVTNDAQAKKSEAIKSITRSGTTFTATRCDDTTFTFTQQDNNTIPSAICDTDAATAAKVASCTSYKLQAKSYFQLVLNHGNTVQGAITLNINGTGAKPIYINNAASSSSNYTLPHGTYIVYYNGTNFYFRTDGLLPASISGNAATATKLGTATVGSTRKPIYLNAGAPTALDPMVKHLGNAGKSNMNDIGRLYPSVGMTSLSDPSNETDNPMDGSTKSTGWHLYFDASYSDDPNGSNAWVAQIANRAGTDRWYVRSRKGGTITNGTAWDSTWRHLVTSHKDARGSASKPVYVNENGEVIACDTSLTDYLLKTGGTVSGTLILSRTQDAEATANNKPALIVGGTDTQAHLEFDNNEIIAKASGTTAAALYLNSGSGLVYANGLKVARLTADPTSGRLLIADGTNGQIKDSGRTINSYPLKFYSSWTYNVVITSSTESGQIIWLFTPNGYITIQTFGKTIYLATRHVTNISKWTYVVDSTNKLKITLNCTDHTPMFIFASDNNISVTFTDTSTPQANTMSNNSMPMNISGNAATVTLSNVYPIGTIIHSTTCDTEAKVKAAYGGNSWKQHSGYVLRGATSGVTANSNTKTGGSDDAIVVTHDHTFTGTAVNTGTVSADHAHLPQYGYGNFFTFGAGTNEYSGGFQSGQYYQSVWNGRQTQTSGINTNHVHTVIPAGTVGSKGSSGTGKNIPNYKSVYIWERIT